MNLNNPLEKGIKAFSDILTSTSSCTPTQEPLESALEILANSAESFRCSYWPGYTNSLRFKIFEHLQQSEKHAQKVLSEVNSTGIQKLDAEADLKKAERLARIISSYVVPNSTVFTQLVYFKDPETLNLDVISHELSKQGLKPLDYRYEPTIQDKKQIELVNSLLTEGLLSPRKAIDLRITIEASADITNQTSRTSPKDVLHFNIIPYIDSPEMLEMAIKSSLYGKFRGGFSVALERAGEKPAKINQGWTVTDEDEVSMLKQVHGFSDELARSFVIRCKQENAEFAPTVIERFKERLRCTALVVTNFDLMQQFSIKSNGQRVPLEHFNEQLNYAESKRQSYEYELPGSLETVSELIF